MALKKTNDQNNPADSQAYSKAIRCVRALYDKKAESVRVYHVTEVVNYADYFVVCSAHSERQVQAMADSLGEILKPDGLTADQIEGYSEARWVLVDGGDVIVHIFLDALRDYYDLDGLWSEAERVNLPPDLFAPSARHESTPESREARSGIL